MRAQSQAAVAEQPKPGVLTYLVVAGFLTILTAMEVTASYIPALRSILVPILIVLSGGKFALVVLFYMHLKYDSWVFSGVFVLLVLLAPVLVVALVILMKTFFGAP